jgi:pimeloyl-ACP methyl ester carboxylesterase
MFASLPVDPFERSARSSDAQGLANSLRRSGTGTQEWLAPALHALATPTLALAGSEDAKFAREAVAIAKSVMSGQSALVGDAFHAAHLEQPERAAQLVTTFRHRL